MMDTQTEALGPHDSHHNAVFRETEDKTRKSVIHQAPLTRKAYPNACSIL